MTRSRLIVAVVFCGVTAVLSAVAAVLFVARLLYLSSGGAAAVTVRPLIEEAGAGDAAERVLEAGATIVRVARRWGLGDPRVTVSPVAGTVRVELPVGDAARLRRLLTRRSFTLQLVEREVGSREADDGLEVPAGQEVACTASTETRSCYVIDATPVISRQDIRYARPVEGAFGEPSLIVSFTASAAERLQRFSSKHDGQLVAVLIDDVVVTVPMIDGEISDQAVIRGQLSEEETHDLAIGLRSGTLPPLTVIAAESISPEPWLRWWRNAFAVSLVVLLASLGGAGFFIARLLKGRSALGSSLARRSSVGGIER